MRVTATPHPATWPTWLAVICAGGALVVALRVWRGHRAAHRLLATATSDVPASWRDAMRAPTPLLRSAAISSPLTVGVLRPRVDLPAAADAWSAERLRAVFVHELGHVQRRAPAIQLVAQRVGALHWWNPLAWLAAARLRSCARPASRRRAVAPSTSRSRSCSRRASYARRCAARGSRSRSP